MFLLLLCYQLQGNLHFSLLCHHCFLCYFHAYYLNMLLINTSTRRNSFPSAKNRYILLLFQPSLLTLQPFFKNSTLTKTKSWQTGLTSSARHHQQKKALESLCGLWYIEYKEGHLLVTGAPQELPIDG